jgi:fructose-1,6-bisphosphatase/inositol monophosphatase family enzyme
MPHNFSRSDLDWLGALLGEAAKREIMPRFRELGNDGIRQKSNALDLVTDADERAEWLIRDAVTARFPGVLFVGEESVARESGLVDRIGTAGLAIIVDPVDGTSNFAWGLPLFGVMAAVTVRGETVAGLIHDPVCGDFLRAIRGEGAFRVTADGREERLQVARPLAVASMTGCSSWYQMPEPLRSRTAANLAKTRATFAYRCAAYEYRLLASGFTHFSLHWKLMPWDHAAGVLIHCESGGYSARLDGSPYRPVDHQGGLLSAPDAASWRLLHEALLDGR